MILDPDDAALFYRAWWPLLSWVNDRRGVVPRFAAATPDRPLSPALALPIRNALWAEDSLREQFLAEGTGKLGAAERELIASWKHRVSGRFVVFKHLKKHSIFMSEEVFAVVGLYSPLAELIPHVPMFIQAVLLPFRDQIIIDGLVESMHIGFGPGARRMLHSQFTEAKAHSRVRSTFRANPPSGPTGPTPRRKQRAADPPEQPLRGRWRITATEIWDSDALDLVQPAFIHFVEDRSGELGMIVISAGVDCRYGERDGKPFVEFSFIGDDDGHPCNGRGWASLEPDGTLHGRLFFHQGDDSGFVAQRASKDSNGERSRRAAGLRPKKGSNRTSKRSKLGT